MAIVPVSEVKAGEKLTEDVVTNLGKVLLKKGKELTEADIQVLYAFMIPNVSIESKIRDMMVTTKDSGGSAGSTGSSSVAESSVLLTGKQLDFNKQYKHVVLFLKNIFKSVDMRPELPLLEIRTHLETLLEYVGEYNILTFKPDEFELEDYLYHNSTMVALTSYMLAQWLNLPKKHWFQVALAGLLHDIGNAKVDPYILFKPNRLSTSEKRDVQRHTFLGFNMLKDVKGITEGVKLATLQHHEREDGSGYPLGIKGHNIHQYSKIVAVADIFHAMSSDRYHKKRTSPYLVLDQLFYESFGKVEPDVVLTFINKVTQFHNGVTVRLSDKRVGHIVFTDRDHPTRPWINIRGEIVNLNVHHKLYIEEIVAR